MEVLPASRNKGEVCSCVGREVARTVQWAGPWKMERSKGISRNDSKTDRKQKTYICVHVMSSFFNTVNTFVAANSGRITGNENHIRLPYFMADEKLINVLLTCAIFIIKDNVWSLNPLNLLSEKRFKQITPQTMQIGKKNVFVFWGFFCHLWTCHLMSLLLSNLVLLLFISGISASCWCQWACQPTMITEKKMQRCRRGKGDVCKHTTGNWDWW